MKFSATLEQKDFLKKNHFILFSALLKKEEMSKLNAIKDQKNIPFDKPEMKKVLFSKRLLELFYELIQKRPIRLGFYRFMDSDQIANWSKLAPDQTIEQASSIRPLGGAYLIALTDSFEMEVGDAFFILPSMPLKTLVENIPKTGSFLIIGYSDFYGQYLYELQDPYVHYLKSLGYVFGDRLRAHDHPILFR